MDLTGEVTELLQHLIRNAVRQRRHPRLRPRESATSTACRPTSGTRASTSSASSSAPGRDSLVARIEGSRPDGADAVPDGPHRRRARQPPTAGRATPSAASWSTGEVWGRGAIDMLNLTASMAVASATWPARACRPKGTLVYFGRGRRGGRRAPGAPSAWSTTTGTPRSPATTCSPSPAASSIPAATAPARSRSRSARRASPGAACGSRAPPGTARCPTAPTTRWSRRPRSCAGWPPSGRRRRSTTCGAATCARLDLPDDLRRRAGRPDPACGTRWRP